MSNDNNAVSATTNPLCRQFFHSLDKDGVVNWQGHIIGNPEPGWYLVEIFEWLCGEPYVRRLVHIDEMRTWLFYDSAGSMRVSYEHGVARQGGAYRP
jgi:hypothetical protein